MTLPVREFCMTVNVEKYDTCRKEAKSPFHGLVKRSQRR